MNSITTKLDPQAVAIELMEQFGLPGASFDLSSDGNDITTITMKVNVTKHIVKHRVSKDKMKLTISILPVTIDSEFTEESLMAYLRDNGIQYGMKPRAITRVVQMVNNRELVLDEYVVEGKQADGGSDARVIIFFRDHSTTKVRIDSSGRADYKNIDKFISVKSGDKLMTLHNPVLGRPGINIYGEELPAKGSETIDIAKGENIRTLERDNKVVFFATKNGYVSYDAITHSLAVVDLLVVNTVSYETGSINFEGSIYIKEDVSRGFRVKATGDITVGGVVSDAVLIAGGSIVVKSGIKAKGKANISAEKNIEVGYLERAYVYCAGNLTINRYAYNSEIYCKGDLFCEREGSVISGTILSVLGNANIYQLGSPSDKETKVSMGIWEDKSSAEVVEKAFEIEATLERLSLVMHYISSREGTLGEAGRERYKKLGSTYTKLMTDLEALEEKFYISDRFINRPTSKLKVVGTAYEGSTVVFFSALFRIVEPFTYTVFKYNYRTKEVLRMDIDDDVDINTVAETSPLDPLPTSNPSNQSNQSNPSNRPTLRKPNA